MDASDPVQRILEQDFRWTVVADDREFLQWIRAALERGRERQEKDSRHPPP